MESSREGARYNVKEHKMQLRTVISEKRKQISAEERKQMDASICRRIIALAGFRYADAILTYSPLKNEVDISEVNEAALKSGKTLAFPRCVPGTSNMDFYEVTSMDQLEKGSFSIMEPKPDCKLWTPAENKSILCIIPAMAYDKDGFRLGYGKGFYDRFLADRDFVKVGVVYSKFLVDYKLPRGRFDLAANVVVTEKGCHFVK